MTRQEAIQNIEELFPADSKYEETRAKGIELLEEAKRNANNWRNLPDEILIEYARLCIAEEYRQESAWRKKNAYSFFR